MAPQSDLDDDLCQSWRMMVHLEENAHLKTKVDEALKEAREKGLARGYEGAFIEAYLRGYLQGLIVGKISRRIHICERLLGLPLTPQEKLQDASLDELRAQAQDLEQ